VLKLDGMVPAFILHKMRRASASDAVLHQQGFVSVALH
jgi:hypothetical protein